MSTFYGEDSLLYQEYVKERKKVVFPWSLSIVDCFFLSNAFKVIAKSNGPVELIRVSNDGRQTERVTVDDAYDLYDIDDGADGVEVVLFHEASGALCYWDVHERFVVVVGDDMFLEIARPYPPDIEKHRYIEAMLHLEGVENSLSPESIYEALTAS